MRIGEKNRRESEVKGTRKEGEHHPRRQTRKMGNAKLQLQKERERKVPSLWLNEARG